MKVKNLSIYRHEIVQVSQTEEMNEQLKQKCEVLATELGTLLDSEREAKQQFVFYHNMQSSCSCAGAMSTISGHDYGEYQHCHVHSRSV